MNKIRKITTLFFIIFFNISALHANNAIKVKRWEEISKLNQTGKSSEILIKGKVKQLPQNKILSSFAIGFDKSQNIAIKNIILDGKPAKYSFDDNLLRIDFKKGKASNQSLMLYISYNETYSKINKYLRQEIISIPSFAAGARARVEMQYPQSLSLVSATLNPNIIQQGKSFIYQNLRVPENGVSEIVKVTPEKSKWKITVTTHITGNKPLNKITVKMPNYFKNGGQYHSNVTFQSNIDDITKQTFEDNTRIKFNSDKTKVIIQTSGTVISGKKGARRINRNPANYLKISEREKKLLTPILERIKKDPKYKDIPLYAKIGRYVHEFIHYDIKYLGRLPDIETIIYNPFGVCTEYSTLYNGLARLANIPTAIVEGGACGEYDKCQGHSWIMIYHKGKWINIDPTWNLMSGIVSSSHVYLNDEKDKNIMINYKVKQKNGKAEDFKIDSKVDLDMKPL